MSIQAITTKIISTLGNKDSLIPIIVKDGVDSTSLTYKSFKEGGKVEGIDRAIDEFGTQAIWVGGIPLYKKLIDLTAYKMAKLNPEVDPRIISNKEYSTWAVKNATGLMTNSKTQTVKEAITDCLKDGGKKAENLYKGKVIAATALTLGTYFLLTKTKQKNTKNTVLKDINKEMTDSFTKSEIAVKSNSNVFSDFNEDKKPTFKGKMQALSDAIMFNPVHNMKIIDAGITTERLACSRNKTEFCEHAIKEGGFLFFLYGFGNLLEKGINKFSDKILNKPIDLDIDVIMDNDFCNALKQGKILKDIEKLPKSQSLTDKLNFIVENPENILVKAAKKSKIVSTIKSDKNIVDTSKYIDIKSLENLAENLKNIDEKFKISNEEVNTFLNKTKALKVGSVMANIGISCLFLGYLIPKAVYKYREIKTGTTKFHVEEDIRNNNAK
jgi:hypothetical protein